MKLMLRCVLFGHRWVERPHRRPFDLSDYDCSRCGAYKQQGLYQ